MQPQLPYPVAPATDVTPFYQLPMNPYPQNNPGPPSSSIYPSNPIPYPPPSFGSSNVATTIPAAGSTQLQQQQPTLNFGGAPTIATSTTNITSSGLGGTTVGLGGMNFFPFMIYFR